MKIADERRAEEAEQELRAVLRTAKRVVIKVGSSSLTSAKTGVDNAKLVALVKTIARIYESGKEVVLISSGAIASGLAPLNFRRRPRILAHQQAAAAVGQGLLITRYHELLAAHGIVGAQVLLTVDDLTRRTSYTNALQTVEALLQLGTIPIVNENDTVATQELHFGDNDRLAALVAQLVQADYLVLLSDVDSLYTAHPQEPGAKPIHYVRDVAELAVDTSRIGSQVGTGGMTTKLQAAQITAAAGIPVVLANAQKLPELFADCAGFVSLPRVGTADGRARGSAGNSITTDGHSSEVCDSLDWRGARIGTVFAPTDKRRHRRELWLAYAAVACGALIVDAGAVHALTNRGASLLAAGIKEMLGDFAEGDPVDVQDVNGLVFARGIVNYSAEQLRNMIGKTNAELKVMAKRKSEATVDYERAVIHRDLLMLLPTAPVASQ